MARLFYRFQILFAVFERHQNRIETPPGRHSSTLSISYSRFVMRGAFVVQVGRASQPAQGQIEGWVEEVDSGKQLRFRSTEELLAFLGRCIDEPENPEPAVQNDESRRNAEK
jgi:hypothetical protein